MQGSVRQGEVSLNNFTCNTQQVRLSCGLFRYGGACFGWAPFEIRLAQARQRFDKVC